MVRRGKFAMSTTELAAAVNEDQSHDRRDHEPVPPGQILARAETERYRHLFTVTGPRGAKIVALKCPKEANL
jgi:hypothetical protein